MLIFVHGRNADCSRHPPYRSRLALLMHWAPASSIDAHMSRILSSSIGRIIQFCAWLLFRLDGFLLASLLFSTSSAIGLLSPILFRGFSDTMKLSDSLYLFIIALLPWDFQCGPFYILIWPDTGPPDSRAKSFHACMRSPTPPSPYSPYHSEP